VGMDRRRWRSPAPGAADPAQDCDGVDAFTGKSISAQEAHQLGVVNESSPAATCWRPVGAGRQRSWSALRWRFRLPKTGLPSTAQNESLPSLAQSAVSIGRPTEQSQDGSEGPRAFTEEAQTGVAG